MQLRDAWKALFLLALGLLAVVKLLAPQYNEAQTASSAAAFQETIAEDDRSTYAVATAVDLAFAASYALLALRVSMRVKPNPKWLSWSARAGALSVVGGAILDELENVLMLGNILRYRTVGDAIQRMRSVGLVKWWVAGVGASIVLLAWAVSRLPFARD